MSVTFAKEMMRRSKARLPAPWWQKARSPGPNRQCGDIMYKDSNNPTMIVKNQHLDDYNKK